MPFTVTVDSGGQKSAVGGKQGKASGVIVDFFLGPESLLFGKKVKDLKPGVYSDAGELIEEPEEEK